MKYCTNCLAELKDDALFCPKCGTRQEETQGLQSVLKGRYLVGPTVKQTYAYTLYKCRDLRTGANVFLFEDTRTLGDGVNEEEACRYFEEDLKRSLSRSEEQQDYIILEAFCENEKAYLAADITEKTEEPAEEKKPEKKEDAGEPGIPEEPATAGGLSASTKKLLLAAAAVVVIALVAAVGIGSRKPRSSSVSEPASAAAEEPVSDVKEETAYHADSTASENVPFDGLYDGILAVGFDNDYPPYSYKNTDGSYEGFDIELMKTVCDTLGVQIELVPVNWDEWKQKMGSGLTDCMTGTYDSGNEEGFFYTKPVINQSQVMVVSPDSNIDSISDLPVCVVAALQNSDAQSMISEWETAAVANVYYMDDADEMFSALEDRVSVITAVITDRETAAAYFEKSGNPAGLIILDEEIPFGVDQICCRDEEVCEMIDEMLADFAESGILAEMAERYGIDTQ